MFGAVNMYEHTDGMSELMEPVFDLSLDILIDIESIDPIESIIHKSFKVPYTNTRNQKAIFPL